MVAVRSALLKFAQIRKNNDMIAGRIERMHTA